MLVSAWTEIIPGGIPSFQVVLLLSSNNPNVQLAGIFLVYTLCVVLSLPAKLSWYFSTWHHIYSVTALQLVLVLSTSQTQFMLFNPHLEPEILRILHPNFWCSALATLRFRVSDCSWPLHLMQRQTLQGNQIWIDDLTCDFKCLLLNAERFDAILPHVSWMMTLT